MSQDIDEISAQTLRIILAALQEAGVDNSQVTALAIDGQMGGIVGVDSDFSSITGLDMGLDTASEVYNRRFHAEHREVITATTCGSPRNAPKMMMLKREHPELYSRVKKFVTISGYVTAKIAGLAASEAFVDYTLLSFFGNEDARTLDWSDELTRMWGLDGSKLPQVVKPWDRVGTVCASAARESGLLEGTPVFAGAGDQPAGMLGAGYVREGASLDVSGSTTLLLTTSSSFVPDTGRHSVMYMPSVVPGHYIPFTYVNGGGLTVPWFRDQMAAGTDWETLSSAAAQLGPGSDGLMFVPYFGGRQCPYDADARGSWIGLNWGHRREHLFRATLEGLSYDYRMGMEHISGLFPVMPFNGIDGTGGGARNALWNQMKADVLGMPYHQLSDEQFALRGCAIIAGYGLGIYSDMVEASSTMNERNERTTFRPDASRHAEYTRYYKIFKETLSAPLADTMHRLQQLQS